MTRLILSRLAIACLAMLLASPSGAGEENAPAIVMDEAVFEELEQQLGKLDAFIALQVERLAELNNRMIETTDPVEQAHLDRVATRLTRVLDEVEGMREKIEAQINTIREMQND